MLAKSLILFILSIESKIKCLDKKASKFTQTFSFIIIELKILPYNDAILVNLNTYTTTYMRRGGFPNQIKIKKDIILFVVIIIL